MFMLWCFSFYGLFLGLNRFSSINSERKCACECVGNMAVLGKPYYFNYLFFIFPEYKYKKVVSRKWMLLT